MCNLENVDCRKPAGKEDRIDLLFDVTGEQESPSGDLPEQDDRDVVDTRARVGRLRWNPSRIGPEDAEAGVVERHPVACRQATARNCAVRQDRCPDCITGTGTTHAGFVHTSDAIAGEQ
jgi:hypothetical protein